MGDRSMAMQTKRADTFVVDRAWLKHESLAALKLFFAPFSGIYQAAKGEVADRRS